MTSQELKLTLRELAQHYAQKHNVQIDSSHQTAILFCDLEDNFNPDSFRHIQQNQDWFKRTRKSHQNVKNALEMQSSNSSDALLMNVFCHPNIVKWQGLRNLLNVSEINPVFGFKARVTKNDGKGDTSEIDMVLGDLLIEAKLTEGDFTQKDASLVKEYDGLTEHFHEDFLSRQDNLVDNYQVLRNLLAAIQHSKQHVLLCDDRRPDLVRRYMDTVSCLRDAHMRKRCRVVFWQQIRKACGAGLGSFLTEKYGL